MTFGDRVNSVTQDVILPKVVFNVFGSNVLALRLISNAKQGKGVSVNKAIKYQSSGTATSFAGLDTFSAALLNTKVKLSYDMRGIRIPLAISGMEAAANKASDTKVTDLVKETVEESYAELVEFLGDVIYGDGTGNSNKHPLGLGAIVDDATDVATIGGLARATYSVLNATRTASGGTMTLAKLATLFSNVSSGTLLSSPSLMISDETVWDLYEQLLTPMVREQYSQFGYYNVGRAGGATRRAQEGLIGTQGFVAVTYKGIPWVRDEKATAQNVFMLNENWLDWYGWEASDEFDYRKVSFPQDTIEGTYAEPPISEFAGFNWSGWRVPTGQFGAIAELNLLGNLVSWQPRRHGRLTGVTGV